MWYIINSSNRVVSRSKNKGTLEAQLAKMAQYSFGDSSSKLVLTDIKPTPAKSRLNVSMLSYN